MKWLIPTAIVAVAALCAYLLTLNPWCALAGAIVTSGNLYFRTFENGATWTKLEAAFNIVFGVTFVTCFTATVLLGFAWLPGKLVAAVGTSSFMSLIIHDCLAYVFGARAPRA